MSCGSRPVSRSNGSICSVRIEYRSVPMTDDKIIALRSTSP
jgi:hypothetical protein